MNPFTYMIDLLDEYDYMGPIGAFVGVVVAVIACFIWGQSMFIYLCDTCNCLAQINVIGTTIYVDKCQCVSEGE